MHYTVTECKIGVTRSLSSVLVKDPLPLSAQCFLVYARTLSKIVVPTELIHLQ